MTNTMTMLGSSWAIWTNLAFLVPLYYALTNRMYVHAGFITITMVLSFMYHISGGKFAVEDQMAAVALIAVNAVLLIDGLARRNHYQWFWITVATACLSLVLLYVENKFPNTHGFWHVFSAIVTLGCQFFFLNI